jgi:proline utilization trans-activator
MTSKIESLKAAQATEISDETGADLPNEDAMKLSNPLVEDRPKLVASEGSTFIYVGPTACSAFASRIRPPNHNHRSTLHRQHYSHVSFSRRSTTDFTLPNEGEANLLVESMFSFIGADYYFFLKRTFREKLKAMYRDPSSANPVWLVCMFTVFALGELYSPATATGRGTPGVSFFDQAMSQHVDLYEDPTISYIESLLLIVRPPSAT